MRQNRKGKCTCQNYLNYVCLFLHNGFAEEPKTESSIYFTMPILTTLEGFSLNFDVCLVN
jgi:hypothetical protein